MGSLPGNFPIISRKFPVWCPVLGAKREAPSAVPVQAQRIGRTGRLTGNFPIASRKLPDQSGGLVENVILGAMIVDPGPYYFGRKANKVVVVRSERPDMQLAALQTSTSCLVLTGDAKPNPGILYEAKEKQVPVILAKDDIATVATTIENAVVETRFNQETKLAKLSEIMERHFNFQALYRGLGLAS